MTELQGLRVIELLKAMHAELVRLRALMEPPAEDIATPCVHPDEQRLDLTSMGEIEWECGACGFHYGPVATTRGAHAN